VPFKDKLNQKNFQKVESLKKDLEIKEQSEEEIEELKKFINEEYVPKKIENNIEIDENIKKYIEIEM
jgi:hypothetical protein